MKQNPPKNPITSCFFLGIGAQKSGTSWLNTYLKSHSEVFVPPIKEMHFFGNRENPNLKFFERQVAFQEVVTAFTGQRNTKRIKSLETRISMQGDITKYKRYFQNRLTTEKTYGEISPSYAYMDKSELAEIQNHFPDAKIIFLMRNPVARAWSQMRFSHIKDTREELYEKALIRMAESGYIQRCNYRLTIENLISVFPRNQIHFEFFERLFTQNAVDRICDFLGVTHQKADLYRKQNVANNIPLPQGLRHDMAEILRPQYTFANHFFNSDLPQKWHNEFIA